MKTLRFSSFLAFLTMLLVLSSCRNGKKNPPLITLEQTEMDVLANDVINVKVNYNRGDRQIKEFRVSGIGEDIVLGEDEHEDENEYDYEVRIPADAGGTSIVVTFTVSDRRDNQTTTELKLNVSTPYWKEVKNGIINNALSATPSSWDLVNDRKQSPYDDNENKDMEDRTSAADGDFAGGGWLSRTETEFVLASSFDYDRPSVENTNEVFNGGEKVNFIPGEELTEGQIILAKIRETSKIAIIKITEVVDDSINGGTGNNADYRKFIYKK